MRPAQSFERHRFVRADQNTDTQSPTRVQTIEQEKYIRSCISRHSMTFTCMRSTHTLNRSIVDWHVSKVCLLSYGTGSIEESQNESLCTKLSQEADTVRRKTSARPAGRRCQNCDDSLREKISEAEIHHMLLSRPIGFLAFIADTKKWKKGCSTSGSAGRLPY